MTLMKITLSLVPQSVTVNGVNVSRTDIVAKNGVIHVVDNVIMAPAGNIVEVLAADPRFSTLVAAVKAAGLVDTLSSGWLMCCGCGLLEIIILKLSTKKLIPKIPTNEILLKLSTVIHKIPIWVIIFKSPTKKFIHKIPTKLIIFKLSPKLFTE